MLRATTLSTNQGQLDEKACSFVVNSISIRHLIGLARGPTFRNRSSWRVKSLRLLRQKYAVEPGSERPRRILATGKLPCHVFAPWPVGIYVESLVGSDIT
jgi:hypothetical protein